MASYLYETKEFHYTRAPKSGVVTCAYLDDPGRAEAEAKAIDDEFERAGCPEGEWFPTEVPFARNHTDNRIAEDSQVLAMPLVDQNDEQVETAYIAVDGVGSLFSPCLDVDEAIAQVPASKFGM